MAGCCTCNGGHAGSSGIPSNLPMICLVPRDSKAGPQLGDKHPRPQASSSGPMPKASADFELLDENYLRKHFQFPKRALYLDPFRRPLITFPMTQEGTSNNFNMARKTKINQQILDGFLDPGEAISSPSVFPYASDKSSKEKAAKQAEEDEEIIYILQLPDWEVQCPVHNQTVRTPRFIWHSCKKTSKDKKGAAAGAGKQGGGPMHKPKPWLLSRITDFDLMSQW